MPSNTISFQMSNLCYSSLHWSDRRSTLVTELRVHSGNHDSEQSVRSRFKYAICHEANDSFNALAISKLTGITCKFDFPVLRTETDGSRALPAPETMRIHSMRQRAFCRANLVRYYPSKCRPDFTGPHRKSETETESTIPNSSTI
jgi:hypothetical protein